MDKIKFSVNNVDVLYFKTDKFKTVSTSVFFKQKESLENMAFIALLIANLTYTTQNYKTRKSLQNKLADLYDLSIAGDFDYYLDGYIASISMKFLNKEYLPKESNLDIKAFEMLHEVIFNPNVDDGGFEEQSFNYVKRKLLDELSKSKESKIKKTRIQLADFLSKWDKNYYPYAVRDEEQIKKITRKQLYDFYVEKFLTNIEIYVIGNIEEKELKSMLLNKFVINQKEVKFENLYFKKSLPKLEDQILPSSFSQSTLALVYDMPVFGDESLFWASTLLLDILDYEIFNEVREKKNYCYFIQSKKNKLSNLLAIFSYMKYENIQDTRKIVSKIIKNLASNIEQKSINTAKHNMIDALLQVNDNPIAFLSTYYREKLIKDKPLNIQSLIKEIEKIKVEDVISVARSIEEKFMFVLKEKS